VRNIQEENIAFVYSANLFWKRSSEMQDSKKYEKEFLYFYQSWKAGGAVG
jgi:hypothetical protein